METSDIRLAVRGGAIETGSGRPVLLRGVGVGGWLNMENFITGYPATESAQRAALRDVLGDEAYDFFFSRFLDSFFGARDVEFLKSTGMNLVRIPVNYRHLERDDEPFAYREEGFRRLDTVIERCANAGIYTIIDLHALPGFQNQAWHSDNPVHRAFFWEHRHFRDRVEALWKEIARRYRDNPWIAGYNPINEPADPGGRRIAEVYSRLVEGIRSEDPDRIIFLEGNTYSREFDMFGDPLPNVVYTNHDYALAGFVDAGPYPGYSRGEYVDRDSLERTFVRRSSYMLDRGIPIWVGEFGPVYTGDPEIDAMRYTVLEDQLAIYDAYRVHWSVWTYKDIGLQGLVYVPPESPWLELVGPFVEKKKRLGADRWGTVDTEIREALEPLERLMKREFPAFDPYPFGMKWMLHRLVRHILISEALVPEFARTFAGLDRARLQLLADSFAFENCRTRERLVSVLSRHAQPTQGTVSFSAAKKRDTGE